MKKIINLILLLTIIIILTTRWVVGFFGYISVDEALFTLLSPIDGFDNDILISYAKYIFKYIVAFEIMWFCFFKILRNLKIKKIYLYISLILLLSSFVYVDYCFNILEYVITSSKNTNIYNSNADFETTIYQDPSSVEITSEDTNNLIFIYLESIENTFFDVDNGGNSKTNYMPELMQLAKDNTYFSNTDTMGGTLSSYGTDWTIASMVSQMSGLPLKEMIENRMSGFEDFMPGSIMLGDILNNYNYIQELIIGQEAAFAGTDKLFTQHGNFNIYELTNIKNDYNIPEDAYSGWGCYDYYLFEVVKDRLNIINENAKLQNRNFNITIATIDAHSPNGYVCEHCEDFYEDEYYNVVRCQSKLIYNFVEWCKTQDWYLNTTIIIVGDHPTMAESHLENIDEDYERTTYNCFINAKASINNTKNRLFTRMDMYPTILAALGFEIEGNKLALGTNLFSDICTNTEDYGIDFIRTETAKRNKEFEEYIYSSN